MDGPQRLIMLILSVSIIIKALDFFQADKFKGVQIRVLLEHQDMQEV